jgi:hypothetical protein
MKWCRICFTLLALWLLSACTLPFPATPTAPPAIETPPAVISATETSAPVPSATASAPPATKAVKPAGVQTTIPSATVTLTASPTPSATPTPRFALQPGSPLGIANFVQPEAGCAWMGVGGQALDVTGLPVSSLVVEVGGSLQGVDVIHLALTGSNPTLGPGGFVIQLGTQPVASQESVWLQIKNLAGIAQTEKIYFPTFAECERNFILINFSELTASIVPRVFLPSILRNTPQPP